MTLPSSDSNGNWTKEYWIANISSNLANGLDNQTNGTVECWVKSKLDNLDVNQWYHVSAVKDTGAARLFVNGEQIQSDLELGQTDDYYWAKLPYRFDYSEVDEWCSTTFIDNGSVCFKRPPSTYFFAQEADRTLFVLKWAKQ